MYPILIEWGSFVLPAWHTFYVLGALAALFLFLRLARRYSPDVPQYQLARLYAVMYVGGYIGARLLSVLIEEPDVSGLLGTLEALLRFGPMTFYGGAIVAGLAGALYSRLNGMRIAPLLDIGLPAGLVALALGRVGCFLNGDDYGKAAPLGADGNAPFWSVAFPVLKDGIARYPVQLLEAGSALLLAIALIYWLPRLRTSFRPGIVGFLGIVGYANLRFALEFLRDDFRGFAFGTWLSTSQFISIVVLAIAGCTLPLWITRRRDSPENVRRSYR